MMNYSEHAQLEGIGKKNKMTFELFTYICLGVTIGIAPLYMWLLRYSKNTWITSSHETYGGSMTITESELKVTFKDPVVEKK